jgi:hypothetical protein
MHTMFDCVNSVRRHKEALDKVILNNCILHITYMHVYYNTGYYLQNEIGFIQYLILFIYFTIATI